MYITRTFGPIGMYLLVIVSCPDGETQTCPVLLVWHPDQYTRKGLYNYTCYTYGTICRNRIGEWGGWNYSNMEQSSWNGGHWNCKRESKASSSGASCQSHDTTPARHDQQNPFPRHFHKNMNAFHSGSLCHFVPVRVGSLCRERSRDAASSHSSRSAWFTSRRTLIHKRWRKDTQMGKIQRQIYQ